MAIQNRENSDDALQYIDTQSSSATGAENVSGRAEFEIAIQSTNSFTASAEMFSEGRGVMSNNNG